MIPPKEITQFQKEILDWYAKNQRDLPWRHTRDPYRILVSEIMLQQTQVARVIPKYEAWLIAFPTVEALAKAKTSEVLWYWSGLGYNRRALYLQKCAQTIVEEYSSNGVRSKKSKSSHVVRTVTFPRTVDDLKKLPGIGEYTAAAVACFAFDQQVAVVDTNVRKVILTKFNYCHCEKSVKTTKQSHDRDCRASLAMTEKELQEIATMILPKGRAYEWNQALMDYASGMLKKEILQSRTKQSTFKDSDRYYRGQIIKILIEKKEVRIKELMGYFQKDEIFVKRIAQGLEKDGMVKEKKGKITIL